MSPTWQSPVISVYTANKSHESVSVPCSGWYGLCFHYDPLANGCTCSFRARLVSDSHETTSLVSLPHKVSEEEVLSSIQIGTRVYLHENARVVVDLDTTCKLHSTTPSAEWCLVLQDDETPESSISKKTLVCAECRRLFASLRSIKTHFDTVHKKVDLSSIWNQPLEVLYQDESLAVINKPQGMAVMGDSQTLCKSDLLLALAGDKTTAGVLNKPVPVHRLDAATGGLLVVAKIKSAERALKNCFAERTCRKRYLALAVGKLEPTEGAIEEAIDGKPATTHYKVLQHTRSIHHDWVTTVELHPLTGRKHQLRKHLKHVGHPIYGDKRYGHCPKNMPPCSMDGLHTTTVEQNCHARLCLWAAEISFPHPDTEKELTVSLGSDPDWLTSLVAYEEQQWHASVST